MHLSEHPDNTLRTARHTDVSLRSYLSPPEALLKHLKGYVPATQERREILPQAHTASCVALPRRDRRCVRCCCCYCCSSQYTTPTRLPGVCTLCTI